MMVETNDNKNDVLQVRGLTKKFGELVAINNVNFNVSEGEILGIIGPNGSGKTTLFNMMSGVLEPTEGKIFALQNDLTINQKIKRKLAFPIRLLSIFLMAMVGFFLLSYILRGLMLWILLFLGLFIIPIVIVGSIMTIGYIIVVTFTMLVFDVIGLSTDKIPEITYPKRDGINMNGKYAQDIGGMRPDLITNEFGIARTFQIVRPFKLMSAQDNAAIPHIPNKLFTKPSTLKSSAVKSLLDVDLGEKKNYPALILPHGDLKRLDITRTIATDSKIILLDEPFSGLSVEDSFRVTQLIKTANKEFGVTILIVEHKLRLLSNLVNRIIVLDQGSVIADGTPEEISQDKHVIASYLGEEAFKIVGS
ncbi:MAG: ABC transporter ATP-binding protein [Candidatus Kariarchaeaceae archaeon]|jgi:branched-chain amino acid transport system ATP-binding protein